MTNDHLAQLHARMEAASAFADSLVGLRLEEAEALAGAGDRYIQVVLTSNAESACSALI
jgi:hypothetical protein